MLPIVSEEIAEAAFAEIFKDMPAWRKKILKLILLLLKLPTKPN